MTVAYFYMTRKFNYWRKQGVFEIPPMPFIGNIGSCLSLKQSPQHFLKNLYEQAEGQPYIGFYILDKPALLIRDPTLLQKIFIKDFNYFNDRYNASDANDRIGCANLFFLKNPAWKFVRTKLTSFFTSAKLKNTFDLILRCAKNLEEHFEMLKLDGNII